MNTRLKNISKTVILILSLLSLLILGQIDVHPLGLNSDAIDKDQWWIYLWAIIVFTVIYFYGKVISKYFYLKDPELTKVSFKLFHIGLWWWTLTLITILLFYWLPYNRSYKNEYCFASFPALITIVFIFFNTIEIIKENIKIRKPRYALYILLSYVLIGISFGIVIYDIQEVHRERIFTISNNSFLTYIFHSLVSGVAPKDIIATNLFTWIMLIFWQSVIWLYRLVCVTLISIIVKKWINNSVINENE